MSGDQHGSKIYMFNYTYILLISVVDIFNLVLKM